MTLTKETLETYTKGELIKLFLLRNNDAKDYAKQITELQKENKRLDQKIMKQFKDAQNQGGQNGNKEI